MYEYYDAVLHAVREGLLLVDRDGGCQLVNDEGAPAAGSRTSRCGPPVAELGLPRAWCAR